MLLHLQVMCLQTVVSSIFIESETFFSTMLLEKENLFFYKN